MNKLKNELQVRAHDLICKLKDNSIFIGIGRNPYGFQISIGHPLISELLKKYKQKKGLPDRFGLSDCHRFEFELAIIKIVETNGNDYATAIQKLITKEK